MNLTEAVKEVLDRECLSQQQGPEWDMSFQRCDGELVDATCWCCKRNDALASRIADRVEFERKVTC